MEKKLTTVLVDDNDVEMGINYVCRRDVWYMGKDYHGREVPVYKYAVEYIAKIYLTVKNSELDITAPSKKDTNFIEMVIDKCVTDAPDIWDEEANTWN